MKSIDMTEWINAEVQAAVDWANPKTDRERKAIEYGFRNGAVRMLRELERRRMVKSTD